ncbi:MAG: methyl-accepting chemotaxis protein [Limnobacter sp.]|uniref:methyl-accepting chemotaxis protein n=1 Tax=Limnobacter sp. TaxID=2003368 RepID=UPI0022C2D910|nr:methyl-accepting chemotaxis protein [Limnobacter sp.]MCZ8014363.1 methyl-accepting chemotaxis protein [Limnobacter sp.]
MKRQSIQSLLKLNAGFSLGILLVLGAGSTTAMLELNSAVNELTSSSESVRTQMDADMMHDALRGDVLEAIKLQLMADSSGKAAVLNAVDEHGNRLLSNLGENRSNPDNQELAKEMDEVSRVAERYVASARQMTKDAAGAVPTDKQWEQFMADFESLEQSMEKLSDSLASKAATAKASSRTVVELALAIMIGLIVLAITGVFVIVRRLGKSIGQPLDALVKTVTRIDQQGDLSLRAENRHNNEIGDVIKAFNALMESLQNIVRGVRLSSQELLSSSNHLGEAASQSLTSSQANSDAASSVAAAVEELSVSVANISSQAQLADEASKSSLSLARQAGLSTDKAASEMRAISGVVKESAQTMVELASQVKGISDIAGTIRGIAQQTNLLALNAAIEAARAGEQGRGFAVVADEVRSLAERTADSTLKIGSIIESIQKGTQIAVEQMQSGVERVNLGVQISDDVGTQISGVTEHVRQAAMAVAHISESLREQDAAGQDIARSIERVAVVSEENYGVAQETSDVAKTLSNVANQLESQIARFRVAG